nr:lipid II flippase MurJ [Cellulomonas sp. APG4]
MTTDEGASARPGARHLVAGLAGAAALIALVNVASRIVGFLRWLAMADQVGPNALGTAYTSANTLPNVLFEVAAGGALAGAVVPLVAAPLARSIRADVDRTTSALIGWAMVVLVPIALVVAVAARPLVAVFLDSGDPGQLDVAARFLAMFAPQIPLYGLGVVLTGVLQAQRRFLAAAMAPLLNSLVVIVVFYVFGAMAPGARDAPGAIAAPAIAVLGWGTTAGVAVMSLPLLWPVHRSGVRLRPTLRFPDGVAARARALALAGLGALVAQQVSVLVALRLANEHGGDGAFPVFLYTQAVYLLPYAVLAFPLATATLPRLAERAAQGDRDGFAHLSAITTRTVLVVAVVGASALIAVAPAVEQVFAPIADGDVTGMASGITWMAPGLLGFSLILHLSRALYALDHGRAAVMATATGWLTVAAASAVVVVALTPGGPDQAGTLRGLGLGTSVGMAVAGAGLVLGVVRAAGAASTRGVARTFAVAIAGGAAGALAGRWCVDALAPTGPLGAVGAGAVGAAVAGAVVLVAVGAADRATLRGLTAARRS